MWAGSERAGRGFDAISLVVHFVVSVLAAGSAGTGSVSDRVADSAAVPNSGDCGGWRIGVVEGNIVTASEDFARAEDGIRGTTAVMTAF